MSKYLPNYIVDKEYEVPCRGNEAAIYIRTDTDKQLCMCAEIGRERERENGKLFCTASFSSTNGGCM